MTPEQELYLSIPETTVEIETLAEQYLFFVTHYGLRSEAASLAYDPFYKARLEHRSRLSGSAAAEDAQAWDDWSCDLLDAYAKAMPDSESY
jgi:hypothetical protein